MAYKMIRMRIYHNNSCRSHALQLGPLQHPQAIHRLLLPEARRLHWQQVPGRAGELLPQNLLGVDERERKVGCAEGRRH